MAAAIVLCSLVESDNHDAWNLKIKIRSWLRNYSSHFFFKVALNHLVSDLNVQVLCRVFLKFPLANACDVFSFVRKDKGRSCQRTKEGFVLTFLYVQAWVTSQRSLFVNRSNRIAGLCLSWGRSQGWMEVELAFENGSEFLAPGWGHLEHQGTLCRPKGFGLRLHGYCF